MRATISSASTNSPTFLTNSSMTPSEIESPIVGTYWTVPKSLIGVRLCWNICCELKAAATALLPRISVLMELACIRDCLNISVRELA
jgi:hypothetical protein